MKRSLQLILCLALGLTMVTVCSAQDVMKIGVLQAFTGPIESLTPPMAKAADYAIQEVMDSGAFLDGTAIESVRADSTCIDAAAATTAAERLVTVEKVAAIMGPSCSGTSAAVATKVSATNGIPTISSSATSAALSEVEDNGYFYRTAPSDARQGQILAKITIEKGIKEVAITYTNNDYGKGLSESFGTAFKQAGGKILMISSHEDGKADYSAEVASLAASGAEYLVIFGFIDQGGKGIIQASLDSGAFDQFIFTDGMIGPALTEHFGSALNGSYGTMPGGESEATQKWKTIATEADIPIDGPFRGSSYDATAIIIFAAQAGKSIERASIQAHIMAVANAPGEKIYAGDLKKGLELLAQGKDIDYVGAENIEFNEIGEVLGTYQEMEIIKGEFVSVAFH